MSFFDYFKSLKSSEFRLAWAVALAADALQIVGLPLFAAGALSPADDVLDIVVASVLVRLLGWHWAFLPSLAAELVPGLDLFPTWTAAVWFVTRNSHELPEQTLNEHIGPGAEPEFLPPEPAPGKAGASRWRR
jgi:hypothetical protein